MSESKSKTAKMVVQPISAGFPNPAEDSGETPLDIAKVLIKRPASTFFMRVDGDSMVEMGIYSGDLIVVDKSLEKRSGDVIAAYIDGVFTLKQFIKKGYNGLLMPANPKYQPIKS